MESFLQDVRFGIRMLAKNPGFAALAIGVLALGIGANSAIFSVVHGVLLRQLPYRAPEQLVTLLHDGRYAVSPADYLDWKAQSRSFADMAAAEWWEPTLTGWEQPERIRALRATSTIFSLLGNRPAHGRTFLPDEDSVGKENVVVLSHRLWLRRFGGDVSITGRTLTFDGAPYTVIGIMPPDFEFAPFWATRAEMWAPLPLAPRAASRRGRSLRVFARLETGISPDEAQAEMNIITGNLEKAYPETNSRVTATVVPLHEKVVGDIRPALLVLLGAVAFVLLITCTNIAGLLLARASGRERETAIRTALGAGRGRLIRQFLTESVLLAVAGGALGVLLARWGVPLLVSLSPPDIPRLTGVHLNHAVLAVTASVTLLLGIAFGLVPALRASRVELNEALKEGGRSTEARGKNRSRALLVVLETALSLVLLVSATLMIRSLMRLQQVDPGFKTHNLLSMVVSVAGSSAADPARRGPFFRELVTRLRDRSGIKGASAINHLPLAGDVWTLTLVVEGRPVPLPAERAAAVYRVVFPDYFRTMGIRLMKGRDFDDRDVLGAPGVVIVNDSLARSQWPGEDPIGRRISTDDSQQSWRTVIGVIQDVKQNDWKGRPGNEMYFPYFQEERYLQGRGSQNAAMTLVLRTAADPASLAAAAKSEIWSLNKNLPVSEILTMEQVVADAVAAPRFNAVLLGLFATLAVLLAAMGVFGLISYTVTRRAHEIGVRIALGARRGDVLWMVLRQGMALCAAGIALGIPASLLLTRLLAKLLYGISPQDPWSFILVPLLLISITALACYLPARRAAGFDPALVLRRE